MSDPFWVSKAILYQIYSSPHSLTPIAIMIPSRVLLAQAKNVKPKFQYPVEMTPLFAAVGIAICSATFFTYRHFAHDKELRLWKNAELSELNKVLDKAADEEK